MDSRKSATPLVDAGSYSFPRPCPVCSIPFLDRAEYWAHLLKHEDEEGC